MSVCVRLGDFILGPRLGEGASSLVFRAVHAANGAEVALKVLRPERAFEVRARERFEHEVRTVARLDHPAIVRLLDHGVVDGPASRASGDFLAPGSPWLAMELARGEPLADRLARPVAWADVRELALALLSALAHAHARGVVHGDIKPANVLLRSPGDPLGTAALADLGLCQVFAGRGAALGGRGAGTPGYMAPEQLAGSVDIGPGADLYALGALLYHALTGAPPFPDVAPAAPLVRLLSPPPPLRPRQGMGVPEGIEAVMAGFLAGPPRDRWVSAAEASRALRALGGPGPIPHPHDAPPAPLSSWRDLPTRPREVMGTEGPSLLGLRPPRFAGRESVRDRVWDDLAATCRDRRPRLVLLAGPEGVGKSRLARWAREAAEEAGFARGAIARYPDEGGPDEGLRGAVARLLHAGTRRGEALRAHLSAHLPGLAPKEVAALVAWLRPAPGGASGGPIPAGPDRWALIVRVLRELTRRDPLVLWMDDVHHAAEVPDFLRELLAAAPPLPVVVIATAREAGAPSPGATRERLRTLGDLPGGSVIPLGPLEPEEVRGLVRGLVRLHPDLVGRIADASGGHPLLAIQMVEDLAASGALRSGGEDLDIDPAAIADRLRVQLEAVRRRTDLTACRRGPEPPGGP